MTAIRYALTLMFTPHARGSTEVGYYIGGTYSVYPACAGIDPIKIAKNACNLSLPRMRGDRPLKDGECWYVYEFTPHARGSTFT